MAANIGTIHVRRERKRLVVQGMGSTPRGSQFIRDTEKLTATTMAAKDFKPELAAAVNKMLGAVPITP